MSKNNYINIEESEKWLKSEGGYPTQDYEITQPIDISLGCCIHEESGDILSRDDNDSKTVILSISSFIGISAGARHIYGKLIIPSANTNSNTSRSGYGTPDYISGWGIRLNKELDQKAIELDNSVHPADRCFEDMELGELTSRWERNEEEQLIAKGKEIFNKWFTGGWKLKIEDD